MHGLGDPSPWLLRWAQLLPAGARVLDVACGAGRHLRWLAAHGFAATVEALTKLMGKGEAQARRELMELRGDDVEVDV